MVKLGDTKPRGYYSPTSDSGVVPATSEAILTLALVSHLLKGRVIRRDPTVCGTLKGRKTLKTQLDQVG